jgi:hypothetical protein
MTDDANRRFLAYATVVIAATCVAVVASEVAIAAQPTSGLGVTWDFARDQAGWLGVLATIALIAVFTLISEYLSVTLPLGNMSLAHPLSVATAVFLGPTYAALLAALSQLPSLFGSKRVAPVKVAFNASQLALSTLIAGWAYWAVVRHLLYQNVLVTSIPVPPPTTPTPTQAAANFAAILLVASVSFVINFALAGHAVHLLQGVPSSSIWRDHFATVIPTQVALGLVGVAMAQVIAVRDVGAWGLLLFVVPLLVARSTYHRYAEVNQAYSDTVRSLVAAIEAKDPYTKGHSVRVAEYCVAISRQLGLGEHETDRIEYAALLHDLGKVGITRGILSKPGKLTEAEYAEIKLHPDIGAHIIDSVPYLEDLVPIVKHHHERVDGLGYAHGLSKNDIPLAARIMAVADAYDAMTSERSYREAMPARVARAEMTAGSGTQFDPTIVTAFFEVLDSGERPDQPSEDNHEVLTHA